MMISAPEKIPGTPMPATARPRQSGVGARSDAADEGAYDTEWSAMARDGGKPSGKDRSFC